MRHAIGSRAGVVALVVALVVLLPQVSAAVAQPAGASFGEEGTLSDSFVAGKGGAVDFSIINGIGDPATLALSLTSSDASEEDLALADPPLSIGTASLCAPVEFTPDPDSQTPLLGTVANLPIGSLCPLQLQVAPKNKPGEYKANLILTGNDGSIDRLGLTVSITAAVVTPVPGSKPAAVGLRKPLPATITLAGQAFGPYVEIPSVQLDQALAKDVHVTPLLGADGHLAQATIEPDGRLTMKKLPDRGAYSGSLADEKDASLATVTLNVRDAWPLPLFLVILAIVAGFVSQTWISRVRPTWALRARFDEIIRQAEADIKARQDWFAIPANRWAGESRSPIVIYVPRSPDAPAQGLLATTVADDEKRFAHIPDASDRENLFGPEGIDTTKLRDFVKTAAEVERIGLEANDSYWKLRDRFEPFRLDVQFDISAFDVSAHDHLSGRTITRDDDLDGVEKDRQALAEHLARATSFMGQLDLLASMGANSPKVTLARTRIATMSSLLEPSWSRVQAAVTEAEASMPETRHKRSMMATYAQATDRWAMEREPALTRMLSPVALEQPETATPTVGETARGRWWDPLRRGVRAVAQVLSRFIPKSLVDRINAGERIYITVVFLVAIVAAMNTNYANKPTFGSTWDYATLMLSAFAAATVIEVAKTVWTNYGLSRPGL